MQRNTPSRVGRGQRKKARGFTLIETLVTVGIAGVLSSLAYPSFEGQMLRARRADALVALTQAQFAQERYRANNRSYGSLSEIGVQASSPSGHYTMQTTARSADGYEMLAVANGRQARDTACRTLRLAARGGNLDFASGPDLTASNPADVNRRCWNR